MTHPRITIGMVVRNGERHIAEAIDSFRAQTLADFTLVVHDNASTDRTTEIVAACAQHDRRIRLRRNAHNVGVLANLVLAAEQADTEFFCWAACDDVREPAFLEALTSLLDKHHDVGLACCAVRNIDPDGTLRDIRLETASLPSASGLSPAQRVRAYMRNLPGTPFYGLFRTSLLKANLRVLNDMAACGADAPPPLGLDMILLAQFARDHGIVCMPQPLLRFRRGGISHAIGRYGSLRAYMRQVRMFSSRLRHSTEIPGASLRDRIHIRFARMRALAVWLLSREMRRMSLHYLGIAFPRTRAAARRLQTYLDADMRRLRRRLADEPRPQRIVLFGAGKHTRRRFGDLRLATRKYATIVGVCDDRCGECENIDGVPKFDPEQLASLRPDILLISSDSYEQALFRRACSIVPSGTKVWCLYEMALEAAEPIEAVDASNSASTLETNDCISSMVSTSA